MGRLGRVGEITDMAIDASDTGGVPDERRAYRQLINRTVTVASRHERWLWVLVTLSLLGDIALTELGLQQGLTEGNPVVRAAVADAGIGMLGVLKVAAVGVGLTAWVAMSDRGRAVVPLGLALPWLGATAINATLLFG